MAEDTKDEKPQRDARGRLLPGHKVLPGAGRPKGRKSLTDALWRALGRKAPSAELKRLFRDLDLPQDLREFIEAAEDRQEMFAELLVMRAIQGQPFAVAEVWDRLDPKRKEISGPGGTPLRADAIALVGDLSEEQAAEMYRDLAGGAEIEPEPEPGDAEGS